jgi:hypothetical protein
MKTGPWTQVIMQLNANWVQQRPDLFVLLSENELTNLEGHPLEHELTALCDGRDACLPFFAPNGHIVWCLVASDSEELRRAISDLQAWILPSFGWEQDGDGFISPTSARGLLANELLTTSPSGYFRWRCRAADFQTIIRKLSQRRHLEAARPARSRPVRLSLYELRSHFSIALLVGDRERAGQVIADIDLHQLDSATNTQFMRIRMWHHFDEFDRIFNHPDLPRLRSQPLPQSVRTWIEEALSVASTKSGREGNSLVVPEVEVPKAVVAAPSWDEWFKQVLADDEVSANAFLKDRQSESPDSLTSGEIQSFVNSLEHLFLADFQRGRRRELVRLGISEFLQDFVREPEFPRPILAALYLALLRLWSMLYAGTSSGREEGHVLLELASASLQLNHEPHEVLEIIQQWWGARKVPAQLPYLLDAIELLEREHPDRDAPTNLWLEAAELVRREPERLAPSEKMLWRHVGGRLGMDDSTINEYLSQDRVAVEVLDILRNADLRKVAIICTREQQATNAAGVIAERTGAEVTLVTKRVAGPETDRALDADVVLFVWMASTHAVFRAFDGFDRRKFLYVQGTGSSSIIRSLERWVLLR